MNTRTWILALLLSTGALVAIAPAASAEDPGMWCVIDWTATLAKWTYGDLVYQNVLWPLDAPAHALNWALGDAPSALGGLLGCRLTVP